MAQTAQLMRFPRIAERMDCGMVGCDTPVHVWIGITITVQTVRTYLQQPQRPVTSWQQRIQRA